MLFNPEPAIVTAGEGILERVNSLQSKGLHCDLVLDSISVVRMRSTGREAGLIKAEL